MEIENMKLISGAGSLIAKFDVTGQHLTIKGFGIFRKADGSSWISEPSTSFIKRDGSKDYQKHVIITDTAVKDDLARQAKELLAELECAADQQIAEDAPF